MSPSRALESDVRTRLLDAAERLFYGRGVQAVGIDAVVAEAGVATKTLYTCFGSKEGLVEAYLRRRDQRWLDWLGAAVAAMAPGPAQLLAVFDALGEWFAEPGFNGCAFINVVGELATRRSARMIARDHKLGLRALLAEVADGSDVADPAVLTERLMLLVEGAIVTAHIEGNADAAAQASSAAAALLKLDTASAPAHNGATTS
jgi:AcrR family transcriptional regulator